MRCDLASGADAPQGYPGIAAGAVVGIRARNRRATAVRAGDLERAVDGRQAVREAAQAAPGPGSAPPTPSSATSTVSSSSCQAARTRARVAPAYFATLASASDTTK